MFVNLENPFFIVLALTGLTLIFTGFVMQILPPKSINSLFGYRTPRSMRNEEIWKFAQNYSSKKSITYGVSLLLISAVGLFNILPVSVPNLFLGIALSLVFTVIMIIDIEIELKKQINKNKQKT